MRRPTESWEAMYLRMFKVMLVNEDGRMVAGPSHLTWVSRANYAVNVRTSLVKL